MIHHTKSLSLKLVALKSLIDLIEMLLVVGFSSMLGKIYLVINLKKHTFAANIEGIFIEINLRKSKLLLLGTYHPPTQDKKLYFENIGCALDYYSQKYEKILLAGDFNANERYI